MKAQGNPYIPRLAMVVAVRRENADTATFTLELDESFAGEDWQPGQFAMLYVFGKGDVPISISRIEGRQRITHTVRAVGKVSKALVALKTGDHIGIRGPFGRGWPMAKAMAKDLLIVAGGIGLAPLRPVIDEVRKNRQHYGEISLLYGARSPSDMIFREELESWTDGLQLELTVDHAPVGWKRHVGLVTPLIAKSDLPAKNALALLCGPEIMMDFATRTLLQKGWQAQNIVWSMERSMKCAIAHCGHCQFGGDFICKDGPVFSYAAIADRVHVKEY